ncbi:potassium channel family protein [Nocardioides bizhenqiangii]|uniref:Potassium channel family protein n=1 Tax=Nocardioides bizhenqiangii TaxID=3095076 RepID=A0ABZ0ZUM2_9ACTN|nr:potassium channel family protein [Nocardioides sp. HM61]WQQ28027.1 potassium channel family protein [Nocardioides sp. HM61]
MGDRNMSWLRPVWTLVGLLVAYYAFPLKWTGGAPGAVVLSLLVTVGGLALVASAMIKELGQVRKGEPGRGVRVLAMLLILLVMAASLSFFLLNEIRPDEVTGLQTRTDALYFTLSTMTTVGYGDVHAEGQIARALVCVMIVFNVVVVASLVRAQTRAPTS